MIAPLLEVADLHAYYGKSHILHGVSLHVGPGEVVGLLGRNGVGKSTTLKTIMGLVHPTQGKVVLAGGVLLWSLFTLLTPLAAAWLVDRTGLDLSPAYLIMAAAGMNTAYGDAEAPLDQVLHVRAECAHRAAAHSRQ